MDKPIPLIADDENRTLKELLECLIAEPGEPGVKFHLATLVHEDCMRLVRAIERLAPPRVEVTVDPARVAQAALRERPGDRESLSRVSQLLTRLSQIVPADEEDGVLELRDWCQNWLNAGAGR